MAKKPRIPPEPPRCETCGKPKGGKGYYGAQCQCDLDLTRKVGPHSVQLHTRRD